VERGYSIHPAAISNGHGLFFWLFALPASWSTFAFELLNLSRNKKRRLKFLPPKHLPPLPA
jgi:hypothetical protein